MKKDNQNIEALPSDKKIVKKLALKWRLIIIFSSIILFLGVCVLTLLVVSIQVPKTFKVYNPDYEKLDKDKLEQIYDKNELSDDEYEILYRQTGLTKLGIDRCKKHTFGFEKVVDKLQDCFYNKDYTYYYEPYSPFIQKSMTNQSHPLCYMKEGDILVSSSTFIFGLKAGHAALLTDIDKNNPEYCRALQAFGYSIPSGEEIIFEFQNRSSSILLSPSISCMRQIVESEQYKELTKEDDILDDDIENISMWKDSKIEDNAREAIRYYAINYLQGINYDITTGVLTPKKGIKKTQCAHIVWLAYNYFNVDIDKTRGLVVAPSDFVWHDKDKKKNKLEEAPLESVQVFGADLDKMW